MLRAMERSPAPSPKVIGCQNNVLVIEFLPNDGALSSAWNSLAEALLALRTITGKHYGWHEAYALGQLRVENAPCETWPDFWANRRLRCHLPYLSTPLAKRVETLANALPDLIPETPPSSFVHGDLWGGNILVSNRKISGLIDPCGYYGDPEVDAATLTVFDHPPAAFFDALSLAPGWRTRQPVYRLWMWLIHIRLFGNSYRPAAEHDLDLLGI